MSTGSQKCLMLIKKNGGQYVWCCENLFVNTVIGCIIVPSNHILAAPSIQDWESENQIMMDRRMDGQTLPNRKVLWIACNGQQKCIRQWSYIYYKSLHFTEATIVLVRWPASTSGYDLESQPRASSLKAEWSWLVWPFSGTILNVSQFARLS